MVAHLQITTDVDTPPEDREHLILIGTHTLQTWKCHVNLVFVIYQSRNM